MEQLNSAFFESDIYDYITFEPNITGNCRVNEPIESAGELNKKVLFDVDDLVIDKKYTKLIPLLKAMLFIDL